MYSHRYVFQSLNQDIGGRDGSWNTSQVVNMTSMFDNARAFDQPLIWNTSNVENMSWMFFRAISFNQWLYWDVSNARVRYVCLMNQTVVL
jgi:hypothetical protein